jgi:hypothetical protein
MALCTKGNELFKLTGSFMHHLFCIAGVEIVKSDKLVAETRDSSGTQRKWNILCWKPLLSNG